MIVWLVWKEMHFSSFYTDDDERYVDLVDIWATKEQAQLQADDIYDNRGPRNKVIRTWIEDREIQGSE